MFTVKLGTEKTFFVTAAEESYGNESFDGVIRKKKCLRLESSEAENGLDWYMDLLEEEGALDTVQVLLGDKVSLTADGYTMIRNISQRLLGTGKKYLTLTLEKPEESAEESDQTVEA